MRRDTFTATDFAPPAGWDHHTATSELLANAAPLPGKPERRKAQRAARPDGDDCVRISGELVQDACVRHQATADAGASTSGQAWLQVRLIIPGGQFVMAAQALGSTQAAHIDGERRTRYLRRGHQCTVYGKGLMVVQQQGEPVIQVLLPTIFTEPAPISTESNS